MNTRRCAIIDPSESASKVLVAGLFLALAWRFGADFVETYRPTDLLLLVGAALVVILTCLRRSARMVDRRFAVRMITFQSLLLPLLVVPAQNGALLTEEAAASLTALGLAIVVGGKISLGRSFGTLPANRGVMEGGL